MKKKRKDLSNQSGYRLKAERNRNIEKVGQIVAFEYVIYQKDNELTKETR